MATVSDRTHAPGWVPSTDDFGARLALVRHRRKWNITEAARECGLPEATWRTWEKGSRPHDMEGVCRAIAKAAGVNYVWLISGEVVGSPLGSEVKSDNGRLPRIDSNDQPADLDVVTHIGVSATQCHQTAA